MKPTPRPNILLITTDQQRHDTIHAAGNPHIRTPHLNWLLETGLHFQRCYSDAPICVAARATMITGQQYRHLRPIHCGDWGEPTAPDPTRTVPGLLTQAGYQTKAIGKLHYHPARCAYGFEHTEILADYYRAMSRHPHRGVPMDHGLGQNEMEPGIATVPESQSLTRWLVDRSIDFLETRDTTRPFFLNLGFSKPHPPWDPCESYWQMYAHADVPAPVYGDWSRDAAKIPPGFMMPTWVLNGCDQFSAELLREARRAYYACITQIDYNLGYLFGRLRELNLLESTFILFTADHGEMLGDHHMGAKSIFLEGSAHIPLLVRPPTGWDVGVAPATRCDSLVCLADLLPTCLGMAGVTPPADLPLDGSDLLAVARGETKRDRLIGAYRENVMLLENDWKYTFTSLGGGELLFNLAIDPSEQHNLVGVGAAADTHRRLRTALAAELGRSQYPCVSNADLVALQPAPTRREHRAKAWPGFHTRHETNDVLH